MENKFKLVYVLFVILFIVTGYLWINVPQAKVVGAIYFFMTVLALEFYRIKRFEDSLIGIPYKNIMISLLIGIAVAVGFFAINKAVPMFRIGYPDIPFSVLGTVRFMTIVVLAPTVETLVFEGSFLGALRDNDAFHLSTFKSNLIKSGLFSSFHFFSYGILLGQLATWSEVFGAFYANIGLFFSAFTVSFIFGYLITRKKLDNLVLPIISHALINLTIAFLSVVYLGA